MSIFGKLDAEQIPSNPFFVEKGEYDAEVTDARYKDNRDGNRQLFIEYTITDETSQYKDSKVQQFYILPDADLDAESLALLPVEEQAKIRKTISSIKRTLCGNDGNDRQKGLGVNPDDLNDENWDPAVLKGLKVHLAVNNYGQNNTGVAVRWVNVAD